MWVQSAGDLRYYQFASFDPGVVAHAVLTRHGGVSPAPYASLNLSISTGDTRANVRANRLRAFQALQRSPDSRADLWQVHSAAVVVVDAPNGPRDWLAQADSLITDRPEVTLFLRFADCVPVLLYDPRCPAVGLVHAGWRGTVLNAVGAAVTAMTRAFGTRPADLVAAIGPSIGPCHYQVGPEVVDQVRAVLPHAAERLLSAQPAGIVDGRTGGAARPVAEPAVGCQFLDLWEANAALLRAAGVERIEVAALCTACRTDDFFSHRAEHGQTGRFGALVGLR